MQPAPPPAAQTPARIKADYLYKFLTYVDFPPELRTQSDMALVIGVLGADDVYEELGDLLRGRTVNNRPITRRHISTIDSMAGVHMLFVGRKIDLAHNACVKAARSAPVLLVTEVPEGLAEGAIFNFITMDGRIRFEASLEAAERASLHISSRILTVAERVTGGR